MQERDIEIFISYSSKDATYRDAIAKHLRPLEDEGLVSVWHDQNILPGDEWDPVIKRHLRTAQLVLLLISSDFLSSNYCKTQELAEAMIRHEEGRARVIPVIVRPCLWEQSPFSKLQVLPRGGGAVADRNPDAAYRDIAKEIRALLTSMRSRPQAECPGCGPGGSSAMGRCKSCNRTIFIRSFSDLAGLGQSQVQVFAAEWRKSLDAESTNVAAHISVGLCFMKLGLFDDSLTHLERAIAYQPLSAELYWYGAIACLRGKRPFNAGLQVVKRSAELISAAKAIDCRGAYCLFMAYLYGDYHLRRYLNPPTPPSDLVAMAIRSGVSTQERETMTETLGRSFSEYLRALSL